jgi:putative phosphotransacetylase
MDKKLVSVGLSNRHAHLSQADVEKLFGEGYQLTNMKDLSQPGQFACNERIQIQGPKSTLTVRILGPARSTSQIEVSKTDAFALGINVPVRNSGDLEGTPGIKMIGPVGETDIDNGVIVAARHIHMHTSDAERFKIEDNSLVDVKTSGERGLVFNNVLVRVNKSYALDYHLDLDEGNAAGLKNGDLVQIL